MQASVHEFIELLDGSLDFSDPERSFSPFFSRYGVSPGKTAGAGDLWIYYNRRAAHLESPLPTRRSGDGVPGRRDLHCDPLGFQSETTDGWRESVGFVAPDVLLYEAVPSADAPGATEWILTLPGDAGTTVRIRYEAASRILLVSGRLPRTDPRDPDPTFPYDWAVAFPEESETFFLGGRECAADADWDATLGDPPGFLRIVIRAGTRPLRFLSALHPGEEDPAACRSAVAAGRGLDPEEARSRTVRWLEEAAPSLRFPECAEGWRRLYARAVWGLLSNTVRPHGRFRPYHACFPNRKRYSSHYLWDSCFQSLGLSRFNPALAAESLRLLCALQEEDGKIPQFACATWNRPGAAQPPLIAWAAARLAEEQGDEQLPVDLYPALERWNRWWFTKRDRDGDGLPEWDEALESGWDNSPRWDHGRVEPLDLNSFLFVQMNRLAAVAQRAGFADPASWRRRADELADRIVGRMFDADDGVFFDIRYDTHEPVVIRTPACLLPLWAGVPVPAERRDRMLDELLLAPDRLGGEIPFPTVARSEPTYDPHGWWRGPVWPNIAHLMLETLETAGRTSEKRAAMHRLLRMIERNETPRELYDSRTGEGLGASELGWSCAMTIRWIEELASDTDLLQDR